MNAIVNFDFEGHQLCAIELSGEPWFVGKEVSEILGYSDAFEMTKRLDDDEKQNLQIAGFGNRGVTCINESGLYSAIIGSKKDEAKRFKKWVTAEVLPSIRKTGGYMVSAPDETPEQLALRAMTVLQATVERQKAQLAEAMPKAEALDRIAMAGGSLCITDAAKTLQIPPRELFGWLRANAWIYRRPNTSHDVGYQDKINAGLLEHKTAHLSRTDGSEKITTQVRVTPLGIARLSQRMIA